jgi:2-haloacid dehalogenase
MSDNRVDVVGFDVNETLFSLTSLGPAFEAAGLPASAVPVWFARILRDGFGLTVHGAYVPFEEVARAQLRGLKAELDDASVDGVMKACEALEPYPDVEPALRFLQEAGVTVVTVTNGGVPWVEALLRGAALESYVEHNVSVEAVGRWKPAPEVYRHAATVTSTPPHRIGLVSAHAHDCDAARRAGLRTGRVDREGIPAAPYFLPPDVRAASLTDVVTRLVRGPW